MLKKMLVGCGIGVALVAGIIGLKAAPSLVNPGLFGGNDRGFLASFNITNSVVGASTNTAGSINMSNVVSASAVGSLGSIMDISAFDNVGIGFNATNGTSTAVTLTFGLKRSPDGINLETSVDPRLSWSITCAANTNTTWYTNLGSDIIGSVAGLGLQGLTNTTVGILTNDILFATTKVKQNNR